MQFPITLSLGPLSLSAHFLFETLAYILGFRYYLRLREHTPDQISSSDRVWIFIGAGIGALILSRILGGLENPPAFFQSGQSILYYYGNKTIVGGLLGGLIGTEITKKLTGTKQSSGDLLTYPLILATIIGRIGCFSSGVYETTYGVASTLPFAMDLGDGILRHPVTLYEMSFLIVLWVMLMKLADPLRLISGVRFKLFMISYLTFRFALDFIKPGFVYSFGLSSIQVACILGLLYYSPTIFRIFFNLHALKESNARYS